MLLSINQSIENILRRAENDNEIIIQLKQIISEQESSTRKLKESKTISELFFENNQIIQSNSKSLLIKTGFNALDNAIGGFMLGEYIVIGGRPGMGTTQFLVNLSLFISTTIPILYFTFDQNEFVLTKRFISTLSDTEIQKNIANELSDDERTLINAMGRTLDKFNILINDDYNYSLQDFRSLCQNHIETHGVQIIIVDELQLMSPTHRYRNSRELEINSISRELKSIAKDFNVCVIAASQLSRAVEYRTGYEGKRPQLSDLRESGALEQDADKVIFIHRPEYYHITENLLGNDTKNIVELIVAKNKIGAVDNVEIKRNSHFTTFGNIEYEYEDQFSFYKNRLSELDEMPF